MLIFYVTLQGSVLCEGNKTFIYSLKIFFQHNNILYPYKIAQLSTNPCPVPSHPNPSPSYARFPPLFPTYHHLCVLPTDPIHPALLTYPLLSCTHHCPRISKWKLRQCGGKSRQSRPIKAYLAQFWVRGAALLRFTSIWRKSEYVGPTC